MTADAADVVSERERVAATHRARMEAGDHLLSEMGFYDVEVEGAVLAIAVDLTPRLTNPQGGLQGGLVATMIDVVSGRAVNDALPDGQVAVTSDLHVHYLAAVKTGPAVASVRIDRLGRRNAITRVEVHDGLGGRLAAIATVGWAVLGD